MIDEKIAGAQEERGVLLVNTGNGKGKSSAAFGVVARALGHGLKVGVVQFVKGRSDTGEEAFFRKLPEVAWHVGGEGFTWETQDKERDAKAAQNAWEVACTHLNNPDIGLVVLDEMTYAFKYGWLDLDSVIAKPARPAADAARHHHRPRRPRGIARSGRHGERDRQRKTCFQGGHQGDAGTRLVSPSRSTGQTHPK